MNNLHIAFEKVDYQQLKSSAERNISELEWSNSLLHSLIPFEKELKQQPKPHKLSLRPKEEYFDFYEFGFDKNKRLILMRIVREEKVKFEKFFAYHGDVVFSYYFDAPSEELITIERLFFQNNRLTKTESYRSVYSNVDWTNSAYIYEENRLKEIIKKTSYNKEVEEFEQVRFTFTYKKDNSLDSIRSHWRPLYEKEEYSLLKHKAMDDNQSIDKVKELLKIQIVHNISVQLVNLRNIPPIYAVVLDYTMGGSSFIPSSFYVGTKEDREYIINNYDDISEGQIWNHGEFATFIDASSDNPPELETFEVMFDTYIFENEAYDLVEELVDDICKDLLEKQIQKMMNVTDDFVLFPCSTDSEDFVADFVKYVPENLIKEFKEKKWL